MVTLEIFHFLGDISTMTFCNCLMKRVRTLMLAVTIMCEICAKPFGCDDALRRHIRTVHTAKEENPHQCDQCSKVSCKQKSKKI